MPTPSWVELMTIVCSVRKSIWLTMLLAMLSGCQARFLSFTLKQDGPPASKKLQDVDYFKSDRPAKICGKPGWEFLQKEFFGPQCGNCHGDAPLGPYSFNSANKDTSYSAAISIPVDDLVRTAKTSPFLPSTSDLSVDGDVYKGIVEWTTQEGSCP